jgi:hypothetical protein
MSTTPVSFRVDPKELALALDGLIAHKKPAKDLTSILRTTFYYGIVSLHNNNLPSPSIESISKIMQLLNQNKRTKVFSLKELLNSSEEGSK